MILSLKRPARKIALYAACAAAFFSFGIQSARAQTDSCALTPWFSPTPIVNVMPATRSKLPLPFIPFSAPLVESLQSNDSCETPQAHLQPTPIHKKKASAKTSLSTVHSPIQMVQTPATVPPTPTHLTEASAPMSQPLTFSADSAAAHLWSNLFFPSPAYSTQLPDATVVSKLQSSFTAVRERFFSIFWRDSVMPQDATARVLPTYYAMTRPAAEPSVITPVVSMVSAWSSYTANGMPYSLDSLLNHQDLLQFARMNEWSRDSMAKMLSKHWDEITSDFAKWQGGVHTHASPETFQAILGLLSLAQDLTGMPAHGGQAIINTETHFRNADGKSGCSYGQLVPITLAAIGKNQDFITKKLASQGLPPLSKKWLYHYDETTNQFDTTRPLVRFVNGRWRRTADYKNDVMMPGRAFVLMAEALYGKGYDPLKDNRGIAVQRYNGTKDYSERYRRDVVATWDRLDKPESHELAYQYNRSFSNSGLIQN